MKTIAERLVEARIETGMSQAELAAKAKVSAGTIGNIEAGTRQNPREIVAIAEAVNVNPKWLQVGKGPKRPHLDGGSRVELPGRAYSVSPSNKKRLQVNEWVKGEAGGELHTAATGADLGSVEVDFPLSAGAYAMRVRGDGLHPVADEGTVLIIEPAADLRPRQQILVTMKDGRRFCAKLVELAEDAVHATELTSRSPRTFDRAEVSKVEWIKYILDVGVWEPDRGERLQDPSDAR